MPIYLGLLLIALVLGAMWYIKRPTQTPPPPETDREIPKPQVIKPQELDMLLQGQPDQIFLLDVRGRKEFIKGQKLDPVVNVPVSFIMYRIKDIPKDKKIVAVCASGNRSLTAASVLMMQNYSDVVTLEGGMNAWLSYKGIAKQPGCA